MNQSWVVLTVKKMSYNTEMVDLICAKYLKFANLAQVQEKLSLKFRN